MRGAPAARRVRGGPRSTNSHPATPQPAFAASSPQGEPLLYNNFQFVCRDVEDTAAPTVFEL